MSCETRRSPRSRKRRTRPHDTRAKQLTTELCTMQRVVERFLAVSEVSVGVIGGDRGVVQDDVRGGVRNVFSRI